MTFAGALQPPSKAVADLSYKRRILRFRSGPLTPFKHRLILRFELSHLGAIERELRHLLTGQKRLEVAEMKLDNFVALPSGLVVNLEHVAFVRPMRDKLAVCFASSSRESDALSLELRDRQDIDAFINALFQKTGVSKTSAIKEALGIG